MPTQNNTKTLHPRNPHNARYDFPALIKSHPSLESFVALNKYNDLSIDFANPQAVLALNKALLSHFYGIKNYEIPKDYLCPPIPGRADYIHYVADLLGQSNDGKIPTGAKVVALDVGMGSNCIYPIIGNSAYGWKFVGSDTDTISIQSSQALIQNNESLIGAIECRIQPNQKDIFNGIINKDDKFDLTICNPPFHKSKEEATLGSKRKIENLTKKEVITPTLNFGGQASELWCEGGEVAFIKQMIKQSVQYATNCMWFTTLVSKKENLEVINKLLKRERPFVVKTIEMKQGQKISRIIAWSFLTKKEQKQWHKNRSNSAN